MPRLQARTSFSRLGVAVLIALVPLLFFAVVWGWLEAAALACLILVSMVIGFAVVFRPVQLQVDVRVAGQRVVVGRVCVAELVATPLGRRGSSPVVVEVPVGEFTASFLVPRLTAGQQWREPFLIPTERRQVLTVGPATAHRTDVLGLVSRDTRLSQPVEVYVHPVSLIPGYNATGLLRDLEGVQTERRSPSDVSFHALREYEPGDDRRHVHWRSTARTGTLMVREFEETRRSHHLVVIDLRAASYPSTAAAELAISAGASYGLDALHHDRPFSLRCGETTIAVASSLRLLDELTRIEFLPTSASTPTRDLAQLTHDAVAAFPDVSAVTVITGTELAEDDVRQAVNAAPASATALALRMRADGPLRRIGLDRGAVFDCCELSQLRRIATAVHE